MALLRRRHPDSDLASVEPTPPNSEAPTDMEEEECPLASPKLVPIISVLALFLIPFFYFLYVYYPIEGHLRHSISFCVAMSVGGLIINISLIPVAARFLLRRKLFGYDINKKGTLQGATKVPEALGIVTGIVYLVVAFLLCKLASDSEWLVQYNAALACICFMILLGFVDDVLDVPWRVKIILPFIAALPLVTAYSGHTSIIVPKPLVPYVGLSILDLGSIYYIYMVLLVIFCTNSINIHAGINGLEVGQTIVISLAILIHNLTQIGASTDPNYKQAHAFSIYIVLPLLTTSVGLLSFNWYPSSVFVGDTYTYFAGMTMAVAGVLGHFSETLLLFFVPQVLNFLYSCPQIFGLVHCPRHRLPRFDPQTGLLTGTNDMNLVNLFLHFFGRCTEKTLCIRLLMFQAFSCVMCFGLRYILAGWYK